MPTRKELTDATTHTDTEGNSAPGIRNAPGRDATDATDNSDADATNATDDGTERGNLTDVTDARERDELELDKLAMNADALSPVEPTPAVRKQLEPMICLGDLLETVASEIAPTPTAPFAATLFAGVSFHSCSANEGD